MEAVSEWIDDVVAIIRGSAITGFEVFIADVDALFVFDEGVAIVVEVFELAEIRKCRIFGEVCGVGIDEMAAWVNLASEDFRHRLKAAGPGRSNPENRIDAIVVLQRAELKGVRGIDDDDDFPEIGFRESDHVHLMRHELKLMPCDDVPVVVFVLAHVKVVAFATLPADEHERSLAGPDIGFVVNRGIVFRDGMGCAPEGAFVFSTGGDAAFALVESNRQSGHSLILWL